MIDPATGLPIDPVTGLPLDPVTGLPLDPSMTNGIAPPMLGPDGMPMDPAMLAGQAPPVDPMAAPPAPQPEPVEPMGPPPDPADLVIELLMNGTPEEIEALLEPLSPPELAMLRELVVTVIEGQDPARADFLMTYLPDKREGGKLPPWMDAPPAKPTPAQINELALADYQAWEQVINQDLDTMEYLTPPFKSAVFNDFNAKKHERYASPILFNEINLIVAKGSASSYTYNLPFTDPAYQEAAQQCEDFLYECDRQALRAWADAGNGDLEWEEWYTLTTKGRVITYLAPDVESGDKFLCERLMDPSSTFPTWAGERGLERVTRMYEDTAANVIGDYDDADGSVERKIIGQLKKGNKGNKREVYQQDTRGKVTCYWDRWNYVVLFDDIEIVDEPHEFGFVPFVVSGGNAGIPRFFGEVRSSPDLTLGDTIHDTLLKKKYPSHIEHMKEFAGIREQVGAIFMTIMARQLNPSRTIYQDPVAASQGVPTISNERGAINPLQKDREELGPMPDELLPPAVFQPFFSMYGQDAAMTFMPEAAHGVSSGANQSGNALENLFEVGNDKLVGWYKAMARHKAAKAAMRLKFWRDWGHVWKDGKGRYGRMQVPYPRERRATMPYDAPPAFDFLPETVEMVGCTVDVDYTNVRLQNLTQLGNAVMIWQNANAMSAREAMEIRGVKDPEAVIEQLIVERLLTDPDMMRLRGLRALRQRDPELAAEYEALISGGSSGGSNTAGSPPSTAPNSSAMNLTGMGMGAEGPTGRPANGGVGVPPV
jgi:hypothetical protein